MHHFATYFDSNFLLRGLALYRSLERNAGPFRLHVLCLDDAAADALERLALESLEIVRLAELEAADPELLATKDTRSRVEYFFTCTAAFLSYLLRRHAHLGMLTYLDADLYFYSSPEPVFAELGTGSIGIIGHRFPEHLRHLEAFGRYNVGMVIFRNDRAGAECLAWWRQRCIEWCYDRLEDGRFGDQKYLDDWPERFENVVVIEARGANLAPWNLAGSVVAEQSGRVQVDGGPLIFYHFHKLKALGGGFFDAGVSDRRARLAGVVRRCIYAPYLRELRSLMAQAGATALGSLRRPPMGPLGRLRLMLDHRSFLVMGRRVLLVDLGFLARPLRAMARAVRASR